MTEFLSDALTRGRLISIACRPAKDLVNFGLPPGKVGNHWQVPRKRIARELVPHCPSTPVRGSSWNAGRDSGTRGWSLGRWNLL